MSLITEYDELWLNFDGSCEPNPNGVATYGWIIGNNITILAQDCGVIKRTNTSNNLSEWCALGFALRHLIDQCWTGRLNIYGDSQLVINQLTGEYNTNAPHLIKLRDKCHEYLDRIGPKWSAEWISRDKNAQADALSQKAFVEFTGQPYPKRKRR